MKKLNFGWVCWKIINVLAYCENSDQSHIGWIYCKMLIKQYIKTSNDGYDEVLLTSFLEKEKRKYRIL